MSANFQILDQEIGRGARHGVDFGPRWRVLVRLGDRWLLWIPGHSGWAGTGQAWQYVEASMYISDPKMHWESKRICGGGRLVRALQEHSAKIDDAFGEGISKLIDPKKTLVIGK